MKSNEEYSSQKHRYSLASGISLISMSMLFLTLFISFWILRVSAKTWPPLGFQEFEIFLPILNTIVIVISSYYLKNSIKSLDNFSYQEFGNNLKTCFQYSIGFVVIQCLFWYQLYSSNIYFSSGILGSLIYTYTLIHFVHVLLGIAGLGYCFRFVKLRYIDIDSRELIKGLANFWHFLGIVWILTFVHLLFLKL